jgi:hypothetical protein
MPHRVFVTRLQVVVLLVGVAGLAAGCGGSAATGDIDKIQVTLSQFDVTVSNVSGTTLTEVVAEIEPAGPASHFIARIGRLSNNETRSIAHSGFSDRDSVPFSMRNTKASRVTVSGIGLDGKPVRVEVPFKL